MRSAFFMIRENIPDLDLSRIYFTDMKGQDKLDLVDKSKRLGDQGVREIAVDQMEGESVENVNLDPISLYFNFLSPDLNRLSSILDSNVLVDQDLTNVTSDQPNE